jgi:hypothetical protein
LGATRGGAEMSEKPFITRQLERELGRKAEPCDCGESVCNGWTFGGLIGHGVGRPMGIRTGDVDYVEPDDSPSEDDLKPIVYKRLNYPLPY